MRKLYLLILTAFLAGFSGAADAQITYNSITTNPTALTFSQPAFWQGGVPPPNPCILCTIKINANVRILASDGLDLIISNSTIQLFGTSVVQIFTYLEFINSSHIIIGSDATGSAKIILNDQVSLSQNSDIRLANQNTFINCNNTVGNAVHGPFVDYGTGTLTAGIYQPLAIPINGNTYSEIITKVGIGTPNTGFYGGQYNINCALGCKAGYIYGPSVTGNDPAVPDAGTVFVTAPTLPVELVQFLASKNADASVKVIWATAMEVNAGTYEIQRSSDKGSWDKIGNVAAKGNSTIPTNYTFTDRTPLAGTAYYRLKMIDLDGKFKYSSVAVVNGGAENASLVIYRNPFIDQIRVKVNVHTAQTLTITVSDMLGKNYINQTYHAEAGDNLINLVPRNAATGMYVLKIHGSNNYDQTVKLAKD